MSKRKRDSKKKFGYKYYNGLGTIDYWWTVLAGSTAAIHRLRTGLYRHTDIEYSVERDLSYGNIKEELHFDICITEKG